MNKGMKYIKALAIILILLGLIAYVVFAMFVMTSPDPEEKCLDVELAVDESTKVKFIDATQVEKMLRKKHLYPKGKLMEDVDTRAIEDLFRANAFVDSVECFKTASGKLCINIKQRTPVMYVMPNGQEYEFVGKHWYGMCTTAAATQIKSVTITGFTSADLVDGTQVTILFSYAQTYNGVLKLNVSNTGAKSIVGDVKQYEWNASETITFLYANNVWYIIDSKHATTTYWGKTKLSNTIADDQTVALTPKAVYDAGYVTSAALPTKVSELTNDSGYLTLATLPIWDGGVI